MNRLFILIALCLFCLGANGCRLDAEIFCIDGGCTCFDGWLESCKEHYAKHGRYTKTCNPTPPPVEDKCVYPDSNNKLLDKKTKSILACYYNTTKRCNDRPKEQQSDCYVPKEYSLSIKVDRYPVEIVDVHNEINDEFNECVTAVIKHTNFECYDSHEIYTKTWKLDESVLEDYENRLKRNINYQWKYPSERSIQLPKCYSDDHKVDEIFQKFDSKKVFVDCLLSASGVIELSDEFKDEVIFTGGEEIDVRMDIDKTGKVNDVVNSSLYKNEKYGDRVVSCIKAEMLKWNFGEVEQSCKIKSSWSLSESVKSE